MDKSSDPSNDQIIDLTDDGITTDSTQAGADEDHDEIQFDHNG